MFKRSVNVLFLLASVFFYSTVYSQNTSDLILNPKTYGDGWVSNPNHIISDSTVDKVNIILAELDKNKKAQVAVVLVNSIEKSIPKQFATDLFRKWGIGDHKTNNGLLILIVKDQRRIEFEVGYGLEGVLPDVITQRIQQQGMVSQLKKDDYDTAIINGVQLVADRLNASKEELLETNREFSSNKREKYDGAVVMLDGAVIMSYVFLLTIYVAVMGEKSLLQKSSCLLAIVPVAGPFLIIILLAIFTNVFISYKVLIFVFYLCIAIVVNIYFTGEFISVIKTRLTRVEKYQQLKIKMRVLIFYVICFPIPVMIFIFIIYRIKLYNLRYSPYYAEKCNNKQMKIIEDDKEIYLSEPQKLENNLQSISFDIWKAVDCGVLLIIPYINQFSTIAVCKSCKNRTAELVNTVVNIRPTPKGAGSKTNYYECKYCKEKFFRKQAIAKKLNWAVFSGNGSGGSRGGSGGGSGSSSGSSFGGGSSGGGGSGSSF